MSSSLGKSLQRSKRNKQRQSRRNYKDLIEAERDIALAAERLQEAGGGKPNKLKSIWETNDLDSFLAIADAREEGYFAERDVRVVIDGKVHVVQDDKVVPQQHMEGVEYNWLELSEQLTIPKRPQWSYAMSAEAVQAGEKAAFLQWRRSLAKMEEEKKVTMTPYEKNLEVWRQLWRVVERSDVVAIIVDARNPLVFICRDLERYVHNTPDRLGRPKKFVLLLNKADLLTENQRRAWAEYFASRNETFFFFSARPPAPKVVQDVPTPRKEKMGQSETSEEEDEVDATPLPQEQEAAVLRRIMRNKKEKPRRSNTKTLRAPVEVANPYELLEKRRTQRREQHAAVKTKPALPLTNAEIARNERLEEKRSGIEPWSVLDAMQLLDQFALLRAASGVEDVNTPLMVGLVGYPNVGKSSSINAILGCKKVVVSATPGKTKHFQTLDIPNERRVALCDCPGLVFPSFASNKEQMVCDGILSVDSVTDAFQAIAVICHRLPRQVLECELNISLDPDDDVDESHSLEERLLNSLARRRGYLAMHNCPDCARAAKELLRLYVDGRLVYVEPPPTYSPSATALSLRHYAETTRGGRSMAKANVGLGHVLDEESGQVLNVNTGNSDSEDYEDLDSEDERAWAELDEAKARALREDHAYRPTDHDEHVMAPVFYARAAGLQQVFSRYEYFNLEANEIRMRALHLEKKKKKRTNHQLEPDFQTFINGKGEVELRIDDDDGVLELVAAAGTSQHRTLQPKQKSKRTQRRELKKMGLGAVNPSAKRIGIRDY